jgi:hypothetical protein
MGQILRDESSAVSASLAGRKRLPKNDGYLMLWMVPVMCNPVNSRRFALLARFVLLVLIKRHGDTPVVSLSPLKA